jgi:hypothetical protein
VAVPRKEDFGLVLNRYVNQRLLFRLTQTEQGRRFLLEGAV